MAINIQQLLSESPCVSCAGTSMVDTIKIGLLDRIASNCGTGSGGCPNGVACIPSDTIWYLFLEEENDIITVNAENLVSTRDFAGGGALVINGLASLTTINLPLYQDSDGVISISNNPIITTLNLPSFIDVFDLLYIMNNPLLTTINWPNLQPGLIHPPGAPQVWDLSGNNLDQATVDNFYITAWNGGAPSFQVGSVLATNLGTNSPPSAAVLATEIAGLNGVGILTPHN